jgi:phosphoglycolate phosphatase-like HAD superfamily hydrolase
VPEQIRRKLELTGLLARFGEDLFSATMVAHGKPAPDLFLYAAQQLAAAPDRCLVIEDSLLGIEAASCCVPSGIGSIASAITASLPTVGVPTSRALPQTAGRAGSGPDP